MKKNIGKIRKIHPDYLQFDGENDELIMKLIFVKRKYNGKTEDEIVDDLSKLRSAHPDYLKMDGQNDDLIKRFTEVFDKVAPKFSEKFQLKKIAFIDDPKDEYLKKTPRKSNQSKLEPKLDEFNELNNQAEILLLTRPRMKKQELIKKLDIYLIVMRKKFMDDCEKYHELKKSVTALRTKLMQHKKLSNDLIKTMLIFIRKNSVN